MDYKKLIRSRAIRTKILRLLSFIPDSIMLKLQYRIKLGRKLNLKNPERYTEKLQWYKLHYKNPLLIRCVDKYDVRGYVTDCGLGHILTKCFGVYESSEEINFDDLPLSFVAKATIGGGGNSVIMVRDKSAFERELINKKFDEWLSTPIKKQGGREWPYYSGKQNRIIIEEYLGLNEKTNPLDYKFFCFNGKIAYIYIIGDRELGNHGNLAIVDKSFNLVNVSSATQGMMKKKPCVPVNYNQMIEVVERLAKPFPHVRVDLYNINGKIYFGELTFYGASGYQKFNPDDFDYTLGRLFDLPTDYIDKTP